MNHNADNRAHNDANQNPNINPNHNAELAAFTAQVADAYNHLYDLVYLRTHALAEFVTPTVDVAHKKKAWLLHDVLLRLIEELDPGF